MKIIDGKGQLGSFLKAKWTDTDATIYHTWEVLDKSEKTQEKCFNDFLNYCSQHKNERIIFISTDSDKPNPYVFYKRKAEKHANAVIRLPILIGKGAFHKFRDENAVAWGIMEVITLADAADEVINFAKSGSNDIYTVKGCPIPAKIVKELILIGKNAIQCTTK